MLTSDKKQELTKRNLESSHQEPDYVFEDSQKGVFGYFWFEEGKTYIPREDRIAPLLWGGYSGAGYPVLDMWDEDEEMWKICPEQICYAYERWLRDKKHDIESYGSNIYKLIHFHDPTVKDNWRVYIEGEYAGMLHDCEGIGGHLKDKFMDDHFEKVCALAKINLFKRNGADFWSNEQAYRALVAFYGLEELDLVVVDDKWIDDQIKADIEYYGSEEKASYYMRAWFGLVNEDELREEKVELHKTWERAYKLSTQLKKVSDELEQLMYENAAGFVFQAAEDVENIIGPCWECDLRTKLKPSKQYDGSLVFCCDKCKRERE